MDSVVVKDHAGVPLKIKLNNIAGYFPIVETLDDAIELSNNQEYELVRLSDDIGVVGKDLDTKSNKITINQRREEALNLGIIMPRFFIKSKTNDGEFAKHYFLAVTSDTAEPALIIRKLVFTSNYALYNDFEMLKIYKGKYLLQQSFSIKLSTLGKVIAALNEA